METTTIRSRLPQPSSFSAGPSSPSSPGLSTSGPTFSTSSSLSNSSNSNPSSARSTSSSCSSSVDLPPTILPSLIPTSTIAPGSCPYPAHFVRPPAWAPIAQRVMQIIWLLAVLGRWGIEAHLMWFTTWAFAVHTIFQIIQTASLFDSRFVQPARFLWFPVHAMAWMVFLGVNLVFATNTTGLRIPTPESATLAHHFLHIGPLLYALATCPSPATGLVFSHPSQRMRMSILAFPMVFALIYRCIYRPDEVYITNYGDALWIITAFIGVGVAYIVEAISHLHINPQGAKACPSVSLPRSEAL